MVSLDNEEYNEAYNDMRLEILVFRDELKYTLTETINYLSKVCDSDIITEIYNNNTICLVQG
jgi:hypothetical protein